MPKTVEQLVDEAKRRILSATPGDVVDAVLAGEVLVVDVVEPDEFEAAHIPGAVNIPRGWLEFKADPTCPVYDERIAPDKPVLLSCTIGGRSALAAVALLELGYEDVTHLKGGFEAWKSTGYPVERPEAVPVG